MLNQLIQAVLLGGYYAIIAIGLAFMFQVMKLVNLAHGSLAILAAYGVWFFADSFNISPLFAVLIMIPIMALLGWGLQRFLLERSARGGELLPILTTFGLAIVLDNLLFQYFGADTRSLAPFMGDLAWASFELMDGIWVGRLPVYIFAAAIVILGCLHLLLRHTTLGWQIRATAEDPATAELVGVDARRVSAIAVAIAMVTVAISGVALGIRGIFDAYAGAPQLLFAFEATVIGGVTSLWGVLIGGVVLALAQTFGAAIHPQGFLLGGHVVFLCVLFGRIYFGRWGGIRNVINRIGGRK